MIPFIQTFHKIIWCDKRQNGVCREREGLENDKREINREREIQEVIDVFIIFNGSISVHSCLCVYTCIYIYPPIYTYMYQIYIIIYTHTYISEFILYNLIHSVYCTSIFQQNCWMKLHNSLPFKHCTQNCPFLTNARLLLSMLTTF